MVCRRAERIDIECVVRGYITGGGWRQYQSTGEVNGIKLPEGLRKNEAFPEPIFTPAAKNDVGHDEDISLDRMKELVGEELALQLQDRSLMLYKYARDYCSKHGIILADCKFEFGLINGEIVLIDEIFTPDSSRFWMKPIMRSILRLTAWIRSRCARISLRPIGIRTVSPILCRRPWWRRRRAATPIFTAESRH